jgi:hypothetical protein
MRNAVPLVLALILVACPSSPTSPPTTSTTTATTTSSSTTSTTTISTSTTTTTPDGGTGGGGGAPASAHVAVRVTDAQQQPIAGASIVVNDAAGAVVSVATADPTGGAAVDVPAGGSVAAYQAFGLDFAGLAVVDPPDGATARLVLPSPDPLPATTGVTTLYLEKVSQIPPATRDLALLSCGPRTDNTFAYPAPWGTSFSVPNSSCPLLSTASLVAIAYDAGLNAIAWGAALDQPTHPGGTQPVDLPLANQNFDNFVGRINAIVPGASFVGVSLSPKLAAQSPIVYDLHQTGSGTVQTWAGGFTVPQGIFKAYDVRERVDFYPDGQIGTSESHVERRRTYAHLPAVTTFAADALALVSVDRLDVTDPVHPRATWSTGSGPCGDLVRVTLAWGTGASKHTFVAVLPPDHATALRLPDVPAALAAFAPAPSVVFDGVSVECADEEAATGYASSSAFQTPTAIDGVGTVVSGGSNQAQVP